MPLRLYDTLTRETQLVQPMDGRALRFYCCGPTVYGPAHIGNFRTFVMQDIFRRVVEADGTVTHHVRNITDVDDKTIRESQRQGLTLGEFTKEWTLKYHADCEELNLLTPHVEPSAVAHVPEQVAMIEQLMASGHAYAAEDGSVYFRVDSFTDYGKLSRLKEREITTTQVEREQSDEYERESAADFVLWKARRLEDGDNYWESPWGQGRPGWHIECSAMAIKHLGESFDLHSGGVDLIFPHHENEIAQSEAATNKPFVHQWFHIAHLMIDGAKMSKSLGNLYTLADIKAQGYTAEELRYVLLSASYRQMLNFSWDSLNAEEKAISRLRNFQQSIGELPESKSTDFHVFSPVLEALQADLNTADALGRLFKTIKSVLTDLELNKISSDELHRVRIGFAMVMKILGFTLTKEPHIDATAHVKQLAEDRWRAKQNKDWGKADTLRQQLTSAGWSVKDTADTYEITPL